MKSFIIYITIIASLFAGACNNENKESKNDHAHPQDEHHESTGSELTLNDGKKWHADSLTVSHVHEMARIASQPISAELTMIEMSRQLKAEFNEIFKDCSMTGPAHDQLHNFLLQVKPRLKAIKNADTEEASKAHAELQEVLASFDAYFE